MSTTNFPYGLTSWGIPVLPGANGLVAFKNVYFVSQDNGNDGNTGLGIDVAFKSIQAALNVVRDRDCIIALPAPTYNEQLATGLCPGRPSKVSNAPAGQGRYVTLMGASPTTWAFDSPQLYNVDGDTATILIRTPGFRLSGFRIVGDSGSPICVSAEIDGASATAGSSWAPGLQIDNCSFYGAVDDCSGLSMQLLMDFRIFDNIFVYFPSTGTGAIVHDATGSFSTYPRGHIMNNIFSNCKDNIVAPYGSTLISGNILQDAHVNAITRGIVLTGGHSNTVTYNVLGGGTYGTAMYIAASGDNWAGNITTDDSGTVADNTPWTAYGPA